MTHADDRTLVALLDAEPVEDGWREHVDGCSMCRARLAELQRLSAELGRGLAALPMGDPAYDPRFLELLERSSAPVPAQLPPRAHVRRIPFGVDRRVLAAAAVLALLLLVPQARAWLVEGVASVLGLDGPEAAGPPAAPEAPANEVPTEVSAPFAREVLVIEIQGEQSPERLVLRRVAGPRAALRVVPADIRAEILAWGDGFRVTAPGPRAVLELDLSDAVRIVEVRRAGRTLMRRDVTDVGDASLVLPLPGAPGTGGEGGGR